MRINGRAGIMGAMPENKLLVTMVLPTMASMFVQALYNIVDSIFKEVTVSFKRFKPSGGMIRSIYAIGSSQIVNQGSGAVMMFVMNQVLLSYTAAATAVYGAYMRVESLFLMPVYAINNVMVPLIAFNYGAKLQTRVIRFVKLAAGYVLGVTTAGLLVLMIFPEQVISLFNATEDMRRIGIPALRIACISLPFAGIWLLSVSVFQALGKGLAGLVQGVCGKMAFVLLFAFLLSLSGNVLAVWWAFPFAAALAFLLCALLSKRVYDEKIKAL